MASSGGQEFFQVGEIRPARDSDFEYFKSLAREDVKHGWKKKFDKNGLRVWNKDVGKSTAKMVKAHIEVNDVSAATLYDVLHDAEYRTVWDDHVITDDDLCVFGNNSIGYYSMKCPPPLKNRDFINQRCWRVQDNEYIIFNHSVHHEKYPPNKSFVRGLSYMTGFLLIATPTGGCDINYVTHSDPRGHVPMWLLNFAATKLVPKVAKQLYRVAKDYPTWKLNNQPHYKPWLYPEQWKIPTADLATLMSSTIPELPPEPEGFEDLSDVPPDNVELQNGTF